MERVRHVRGVRNSGSHAPHRSHVHVIRAVLRAGTLGCGEGGGRGVRDHGDTKCTPKEWGHESCMAAGCGARGAE